MNIPTKTVIGQEHRTKLAQARLGKKHSEETKAKMRESQRRRAALKKKSVGVDAVLSEAGGIK